MDDAGERHGAYELVEHKASGSDKDGFIEEREEEYIEPTMCQGH